MFNIDKYNDFVNKFLGNDSTGHDTFHAKRVLNNALLICNKSEMNVNLDIIKVACLFHDLIDEKICDDIENRKQEIKTFLFDDFNNDEINNIFNIIENISFSKNIDSKKELSIEGMIVQDADRLDSLGAIGIARTFAYGGKHNRLIYNPKIEARKNLKNTNYRDTNTTSINHFYEKLLKLEDLMNTAIARQIAHDRTEFIRNFLDEFFAEWNGNK